MKKKLTIVILICLFFIMSIFTFVNITIQNKKHNELLESIAASKTLEIKIQKIKDHHNIYVKTTKKTNLYDEKYNIVGEVDKGFEFILSEMKIDGKTEYFFLEDFKYYIKYSDVTPIVELSKSDDKYKKYIVFNENVITGSVTKFYNKDNVMISVNNSFNLPIIIKDTERFYVEYNDDLFYVLKSEIEKTITVNNTNVVPRTNIAVLTYHFVYDPAVEDCTSIICLTQDKFDSQMKYLSDNNYLTMSMAEMENFLDGKIRIPKNSVTLTIDDGWMVNKAISVLEKYKINATLFLITSVYKPIWFESEYLELHSHGDNLHNTGVCPGGQGGGLKCLPKEEILADLKKSRDDLSGSKVFCYPFYEFNDYAINLVKEAGFTMGFIGGYRKASITSNKLLIPRLTIMFDDDLEYFISLIQ